MREQTSVTSMICIRSAEDGMDAIVTRSHPQRVLWEIWAALMMVVDVLPSLSIDERQFVGGEANDRSIPIM